FVDCDLLRKEILINRQSEAQASGSLPYAIAAIQETVAVAPQEALLTELQAFMASCRQSGEVQIPSVDAGVDAMEICAQIQRAVQAWRFETGWRARRFWLPAVPASLAVIWWTSFSRLARLTSL